MIHFRISAHYQLISETLLYTLRSAVNWTHLFTASEWHSLVLVLVFFVILLITWSLASFWWWLSRNRIWYMFALKSVIWWQQFQWLFKESTGQVSCTFNSKGNLLRSTCFAFALLHKKQSKDDRRFRLSVYVILLVKFLFSASGSKSTTGTNIVWTPSLAL